MWARHFKGTLLLVMLTVLLISLVFSLSFVGSASDSPDGLIPHDPIYINGNAGFTIPDPVNGGGSGAENDAYIIENWDISAENAHGIHISNTTAHFIIRNCYVHDGWVNYNYGIHLSYVINGIVDNNIVENNHDGINLRSSSNNTISGNTVGKNDDDGIILSRSDNNLIYHNNLVNNAAQAYDSGSNRWDAGYPAGGNYWSDYTGEDNYGGENQDIPGPDEIGDTPYNIPGDNNQDRYPLMSPVGLRTEARTVYPIADVYAFGQYSRSQLKFDISSIPLGADIISAKLWLYRLAADNWDGRVNVYRVDNQHWDETVTPDEFYAQVLTNGENQTSKFTSYGWDYLDVLDQMRADYEAGHLYTSFRLRWMGDNGSEPSGGVDDSLLLVIQSEVDNLSVFFWSSEHVGYSPYLEVTYIPPHAVSVSIWPTYQGGKPGEELSYSVMVANMGNLDDNYVLTVSDNAGWGPTLLDNLLEVPAGESRQTTLGVTVPANALGCTNNNIIITATSRADNTVSDSNSCIAHAEIVRGVQVSISPSYQEGQPGDTLIYEVAVKNTGNIDDVYILENIDNLGWALTLKNTSLAVPPFRNRTTDLTIVIPGDAIPCTSDNIRIIATSQENENVIAENSGIVHVIATPPRLPTQPQLFSPSNGGEVSTKTPTLRWENAMYAENHLVLLDDDSNPDVDPLYSHTVVGDNKWTTPTLTEDETYYWKVIAQNENGENHSVIWRFTVNAERPPPPINNPPIADAGGPYSVQENGTVELDGTGSTDPDGDPLTYSWVIIDDPTSGATLTGEDTPRPIFHAPEHIDDTLDVTVELSVNDGHGHTDSDTTTVTVQPAAVNLPPIADAGGPYWVQENETVELDGTGSSDPDGIIVVYSWTITDDPTREASLTDSDTATPIFQAPSVESDTDVTVKLTVEDDDGATDTDTAIVTVRAAGVGPPQYELSTLASPSEGGTVTLDPPGGIYEEGTEVTVTAEPADNYEFDHWSGDASGASTSVTITMDSDKNVTAHFRSVGEEGEEGLPLIQLGVGIILIIIIITTVAAIASRKRTASRRQ